MTYFTCASNTSSLQPMSSYLKIKTNMFPSMGTSLIYFMFRNEKKSLLPLHALFFSVLNFTHHFPFVRQPEEADNLHSLRIYYPHCYHRRYHMPCCLHFVSNLSLSHFSDTPCHNVKTSPCHSEKCRSTLSSVTTSCLKTSKISSKIRKT